MENCSRKQRVNIKADIYCVVSLFNSGEMRLRVQAQLVLSSQSTATGVVTLYRNTELKHSAGL